MNTIHRRSILAAGRSAVARHRWQLICGGFLLLMAINFLAVISRKSLTNDEKYHIPAGYYHLAFGEFHPNPEHPPVAKMLAAIPLLIVDPRTPAPNENLNGDPVLRGHDVFEAFWEANTDKLEAISFWARVPMILLTLLLGILIYTYARKLGSVRAGCLAVMMFSLEPTILAHGRIVQTDVPAAFGYLLFFFALQRLVEAQTTRRFIELGLATGLCLVLKYSLVIIIPVFVVALLALAWRSRRATRQFSGIAINVIGPVFASLLVVNAAYYFKGNPQQAVDEAIIEQASSTHKAAKLQAFRALSKIVPETFLFGTSVIAVHNERGHLAGLLGTYSPVGWWYYFPVAFALKTTLPFLLVSLSALIWAGWRTLRRRDGKLFLSLLAIVLYTGFVMTSHIDIGVRHFLPVFACLFVLGGLFLDRLLLLPHKRLAGAAVVLLIGWMGFEAARSFPNYIPYMNQLASRHPHWYYLSDSNVEWGDDTGELADYLAKRGENSVRAAVLGGWLAWPQHNVRFINPLVVDEPVEQTRYIAIGASYLNGATVPFIQDKTGKFITEEQRHDFFAAYRNRRPEAVFGNSIYLFREKD
jgi:4-amino-4-deoxy-L-arabinose transferase-like glycosyltransferase